MSELIVPLLIVDTDPAGAGVDGAALQWNPTNGKLWGVVTGVWTQIGGTGSGLGTVTSVGLVGTADQLTITGTSPITGAGSWTISVPSTFRVPNTIDTSGPMFSQTASVTIANTVTETSIVSTGAGTITIPANFFTAGRILHLRAFGYHSTTGFSPTNRLRVKLGGITVLDSGAVSSGAQATNDGIQLDAYFVCRTTGATGTLMIQGYYSAKTDGNVPMVNTSTTTVDTTGALTMDITWQWGTADPANTATFTIVAIAKD